ncbi:hypothetical protein KR009_005078 [Drosophila setifemur]|nr:hypothetical protein KR009_005078 [Drosophila setifemur]
MCKIGSLSVLSMLLLAVTLTLSWTPATMADRDHMLCSFRLADALSLICKEFNSVIPHKRGMPATELDPLDPIQFVEEKETDSNALDFSTALQSLFSGRFNGDGPMSSLAGVRRRTRQGIADRCCKSRCSYEVLSEYCSVTVN